MKFLIVNPSYVLDSKGRAIPPNKAMTPTGPLSMAIALGERWNHIDVLDCVPLTGKQWQQKLLEKLEIEYDNILICCHTARNIPVCSKFIDVTRAQHPRAHITLGGNLSVDLNTADFQSLRLKINAVVRKYGHYEDVLKALENKTSGDIKHTNPPRIPGIVPEPESLPVPALELLDAATHAWYQEKSEGRYPIIGPGGFGCRWDCERYCLSKMDAPFIPRLLENALAEAEKAYEFGYRKIWCVDNVILQQPEVAFEFAQEITRIGYESWSGMTRPETVVDANLLAQLKTYGLTELAMGVESASKEQLKVYHRGAGKNYFNQIDDAFAMVNDARILSNSFVMLDGPGGTEEDFWNLYRFLKEIKTSTVSFSFFNPRPRVGLIEQGRNPSTYGFYRWPMGCSNVPPERVVQHAMILSGTWWCGWELNEGDPYFENEHEFGVRFHGHLLTQPREARSPIGDVWEIWEETDL